jgi:hypothetical protein
MAAGQDATPKGVSLWDLAAMDALTSKLGIATESASKELKDNKGVVLDTKTWNRPTIPEKADSDSEFEKAINLFTAVYPDKDAVLVLVDKAYQQFTLNMRSAIDQKFSLSQETPSDTVKKMAKQLFARRSALGKPISQAAAWNMTRDNLGFTDEEAPTQESYV